MRRICLATDHGTDPDEFPLGQQACAQVRAVTIDRGAPSARAPPFRAFISQGFEHHLRPRSVQTGLAASEEPARPNTDEYKCANAEHKGKDPTGHM